MSFIKKLVKRSEFGDYRLVKRYDHVCADKVGREDYTLNALLLRGADDWALRLELVREWGRTQSERGLVEVHFRTAGELGKPFQQLVRDVENGVTQTNVVRPDGLLSKSVLDASIGSIVRSYGRIDNYPKTAPNQRVELLLAWTGSQHWMVFCVGQNAAVWHKFPVSGADMLLKLTPLVQRQMELEARD